MVPEILHFYKFPGDAAGPRTTLSVVRGEGSYRFLRHPCCHTVGDVQTPGNPTRRRVLWSLGEVLCARRPESWCWAGQAAGPPAWRLTVREFMPPQGEGAGGGCARVGQCPSAWGLGQVRPPLFRRLGALALFQGWHLDQTRSYRHTCVWFQSLSSGPRKCKVRPVCGASTRGRCPGTLGNLGAE